LSEDTALFYPLAGVFSILLSVPLLAFWSRPGWPRLAVIFTLLGSILGSWWMFDLSAPETEVRVAMFAMTVIPAAVAALVAGAIEAKFRFDHMTGRHPHHRRKRRSRGASTSSS
jgi:hypothetical protein